MSLKQRFRDAVHPKVGAHFGLLCDAPVSQLAAIALFGEVSKVLFRRLVTDRDIDLALGEHEVSDLVVKDSPVNGTSAPVFRLMSDS